MIGFDIERHDYGTGGYPAQLVLQDVLTLHGSQFRNADCIVASPPCQAYSYRAMPWKRAKALPPPNNELFDACFRIQREASEAASRHIPMVVENVCGAQRWVGRAKWHYGSFFLWGDVPALMPTTFTIKNAHLNGGSWFAIGSPGQKVTGHNPDSRKVPGFRFDGSGRSFQTASVDGTKVGKIDLSEIGFNVAAREALGDIPKPPGYQRSAEERRQHTGHARKAASAAIAKIPFELASYIARVYKPEICSAATPHGHASRYTESTKPSGKVPERKGRGDLPKIPFKHGPTLQRSLERA